MRGNECLFEIQKNSYSDSTDSGRNSNNVLIRWGRLGVFRRKEWGHLHKQKEGISISVADKLTR